MYNNFKISLVVFTPNITKNHAITYTKCMSVNRPFPSSENSHFQNEAKCKTFVVKMSFICMRIENHFHINGSALSLALNQRLEASKMALSVYSVIFRAESQTSLLAGRRGGWGEVAVFSGYLLPWAKSQTFYYLHIIWLPALLVSLHVL